MKSIVELSPLRVPPGAENLSSLTRNGEPIVAWRDPALIRRVRAYRLIRNALRNGAMKVADDVALHREFRRDPRAFREFLDFPQRLWGTLAWN